MPSNVFHCFVVKFIVYVYACRGLGPKAVNKKKTSKKKHTLCVVLEIRHYNDVIIGAIASQITSLTTVYSFVYSGTDQRKHQSFASLAFVRGIHRGPVISPTNCQLRGKCFYLMTSSWTKSTETEMASFWRNDHNMLHWSSENFIKMTSLRSNVRGTGLPGFDYNKYTSNILFIVIAWCYHINPKYTNCWRKY